MFQQVICIEIKLKLAGRYSIIVFHRMRTWLMLETVHNICKNKPGNYSNLYISSSGSANAQLIGCFRPWTFTLNIGLNMFPLDSVMSCLHSLLGYSTG